MKYCPHSWGNVFQFRHGPLNIRVKMFTSEMYLISVLCWVSCIFSVSQHLLRSQSTEVAATSYTLFRVSATKSFKESAKNAHAQLHAQSRDRELILRFLKRVGSEGLLGARKLATLMDIYLWYRSIRVYALLRVYSTNLCNFTNAGHP